MTKTHYMLKSFLQKRSHFTGNLNVFRGGKDEAKKNSGFRWSLDATKYLKGEEVRRLLSTARKNKEKAEQKRKKMAIKDYYVIKVGLSTGLRVQEIADLKCKDFILNDGMSYVFVRHGKCDKSRRVWFNGELKQDIVDYLTWKKSREEDISPEAPFFLSSNTKSHLTTRALQKTFKRAIAKAGIAGYSIHATRHTYASHLYKASTNNLRLVQKQLGHSSIQTTQIYADVFDEDREKALERLYV